MDLAPRTDWAQLGCTCNLALALALALAQAQSQSCYQMREAPQLELRAQGRGRGLGSGSEAHPRSDTTSLAEYGRVVSVQRGSHCQSVSRNLTSSLTERFSTACCAQGAGQAWRTR